MIRGQDETRGRIERERVVRLATIGGRGRAHVALGVFRSAARVFCSPADAGQGRSRPGGCPIGTGTSVTILAGFYDEDWPRVWRFGLRGTGRRESGAHACDRPAGAGAPAVRGRPPPRLVAGYWRFHRGLVRLGV